MINTLYFLLDDRAFVQIAGNVVSGGADQFYTTFVRLVIWLCALETGQQRVVNVDGLA
ncbi:hypothetical protein D3C86_1679950 [compost metagenome]